MKMNFVLSQFSPVWQDTSASLQKFQNQVSELSFKQEAVFVLPELFHAGFSMQPQFFAESIEGEVSQYLADLAKQYSINIVAGVAQRTVSSNCEGKKNRFFNTALAFDSSGDQVGRYVKQRLFRFTNEHNSYIEGFKSEMIEISGEPFALFICYDLRFPELFREVAKQVKGFIVIANWPESRQEHWQSLLKARAIENQCFVIGVNRVGLDENGLNYIGGSSVISPLGEVLVQADANQQIVSTEIDLQQVSDVRNQYPFLEDM